MLDKKITTKEIVYDEDLALTVGRAIQACSDKSKVI